MTQSFKVVDSFLEDPDQVRQSAINAGFGNWMPPTSEVGSGKYEGMGFVGHHHLLLHALAKAVGNPVFPATLFFRLTNKGMERAYIHSDRMMGNHTCVAYLSKHDGPESGTAFYRHIPTGLTEMPPMQQCIEMGIWEQLKKDMVDRTNFEQTDFVSGQYNRALIFHAPLFHSRFPLEGIGSESEDGRLIWASHYYILGNDGELH